MFRLLLLFILYMPSICIAFCWEKAGEKYNIEPELLLAIAYVESGLNYKAYGRNKNGSYDIGLMQINSSHLKWLKRKNITEDELISDPCLNVMTGASILAGFIQQAGYNWHSIGAYNAGLSMKRENARKRYAEKVWGKYEEIITSSP